MRPGGFLLSKRLKSIAAAIGKREAQALIGIVLLFAGIAMNDVPMALITIGAILLLHGLFYVKS